jgi:hypothetical protein
MLSNRRLVFVCLHGSAKSLMAAEYARRLAAERGLPLEVISAGLDPDPVVPPHVVAGLGAEGIDVQGYRPRRMQQEELATAWRVVAFGCELTALVPPGVPIDRWDDIPPVSDAFPVARDHILARLDALLEACASTAQGMAGSDGAPGRTAPPSRRSLRTTGLYLLGGFVLTALIGDDSRRSLGAEAAALALPAKATVLRFDFEQGTLDGWKAVDGRWAVEEMAEAPSGTRVLVQRAVENAFNVIVAPGGPYTDVDVSMRFKPLSGREDASGGIVFRFAAGRYYVVRANALEGNFRLYYYDRERHEIASARVQPPALGRWHTMRVVATDEHIQASLDGTLLLDRRDTRFRAGQVGLWTKADSVTAFDDLEVRGVRAGG